VSVETARGSKAANSSAVTEPPAYDANCGMSGKSVEPVVGASTVAETGQPGGKDCDLRSQPGSHCEAPGTTSSDRLASPEAVRPVAVRRAEGQRRYGRMIGYPFRYQMP
jgi:hypothetical protein